MSLVLAIPDYHAPFGHKDAINFLKEVKNVYNPNIIVNLGDLIDCHAFSRHVVSTRAPSGKQEINEAVKGLKESLYKLFPKVFMCFGNHDLRIKKRAEDNGIDESFLRPFSDIIGAPKGWQFSQSWEFDGVVYEHGIGRSGVSGALTAAKSNLKSTVIGHLHGDAGLLWYKTKDRLIFGFNVGSLVDDQTCALEYAKFSSKKSILGCGIINDGYPFFIPMNLDKKNRWTGEW